VAVILPMLSYILPLVGKVLLMIPIVPNKAIPFILGAFNIAHKYWLMLGFPTVLGGESGSLNSGLNLAGLGLLAQIIPFAWGIAEQYLFHRLYEGKKIEARVAGKTSWWEQGKRSIY